MLLTRKTPIISSKYIGLQYCKSHAPNHTAGIEAGTKCLTMSQRMLRRNATNRDTALVAVPIESAAGTALAGSTWPRIGIKITPAPPPQTVLSRNAATAVKKMKKAMGDILPTRAPKSGTRHSRVASIGPPISDERSRLGGAAALTVMWVRFRYPDRKGLQPETSLSPATKSPTSRTS